MGSLEVFCSSKAIKLDNFRMLRGYGWNGFRKMKLWKQNKGHCAEVKAFVDAVENGRPAPIPFEEIVEVTQTTINIANHRADNSDTAL